MAVDGIAAGRARVRTRPLSFLAEAPFLPRRTRGSALESAIQTTLESSALRPRDALPALGMAFLADGRLDQLEVVLRLALGARIGFGPLAETLLQSYLFVGFPRVWNGLARLRSLSPEGRHEVEVPDLAQLVGRDERLARTVKRFWRRGDRLCRAVYGPQFDRLRKNLGTLHPELADWMILEGYGKVLSRPGLTPIERELRILPILAVERVEEQLYSHLRGARRLGARPIHLRSALRLAATVQSKDARRESERVYHAVMRPS